MFLKTESWSSQVDNNIGLGTKTDPYSKVVCWWQNITLSRIRLSRKRPKQSLPKACGQPENRADNHILRMWLSVGQPNFQPLLRAMYSNPSAARPLYIYSNPSAARPVYTYSNPSAARPAYIYSNPSAARPAYIYSNPSAARPLYIQLQVLNKIKCHWNP